MNLNVLYTFDNNYAPYAGVSIHSLLKVCTDIEKIDIYCVGIDVDEENIQKLYAEVESFGDRCILHYIDGNPIVEMLKELPIPTYRNSYAPNLRLFFEKFIAPEVESILYLDCDVIITSSLSELLSMDFGDAPVAVVRESICGQYYKALNMGEEHRYFNSGVIFFTAEWRKQNYTQRLLDMMSSSAIWTMNPDQDYLNLLLQDSLALLPPKFNLQPVHVAFKPKTYFKSFPKDNYYSTEEIVDSVKAPVLLHTYRFCGQFPWHKNSVHPCCEVWLKNKNESVFCDIKPVPNTRFVFAVERFFYKLLPESVFLRIFTLAHNRYSRKQLKNARKQQAKGCN